MSRRLTRYITVIFAGLAPVTFGSTVVTITSGDTIQLSTGTRIELVTRLTKP
jgi:hypothetical protein